MPPHIIDLEVRHDAVLVDLVLVHGPKERTGRALDVLRVRNGPAHDQNIGPALHRGLDVLDLHAAGHGD